MKETFFLYLQSTHGYFPCTVSLPVHANYFKTIYLLNVKKKGKKLKQ